jgi:hypothetical protein
MQEVINLGVMHRITDHRFSNGQYYVSDCGRFVWSKRTGRSLRVRDGYVRLTDNDRRPRVMHTSDLLHNNIKRTSASHKIIILAICMWIVVHTSISTYTIELYETQGLLHRVVDGVRAATCHSMAQIWENLSVYGRVIQL